MKSPTSGVTGQAHRVWKPIPLLTMALLFSSCASPPDIPSWFESLERRPIHIVEVQGERIAYLDAGQGPPVILIHGFGGSMWQWEYQQERLATDYRIITPDLIGSGVSDKPDIAYTPDELVRYFVGFMDVLGVEKAVLVGNSMGAGLAIGMALSHPARVTRLILIDGLPDGIMNKVASPLIKRALTTSAPTWLVRLGNWLIGRTVMETVLREIVHNDRLLTPAVIERSNRNRQRRGLIKPTMAMAKNLALWEEGYAQRLHTIRQPTLILWGAEDRVFPLPVGEELGRTIGHSTFVVIPETGHIPQWEQPGLVNEHLLQFLKS